MNKKEFKEFVVQKIVYLDGATGSNLIKRGMPNGVCPEKWIMENRHIIIELQREYVAAGSQIVYAPTFSGNRIKLREFGLTSQIETINKSLVSISKEAVNGKALVAGDLTMTGQQLAPIGTMDFEELIDIYKEQIGYLEKAGVDLLVVETMMSLQETRAALIAAKEVSKLPIMATMTFESDGRTLFGTDATTAAVVLESLGADAIGVNCSSGPDKMVEIIQAMSSVSTVPIIAKPNAGMPFLDANNQTMYDMDAEVFGRQMKKLVEAGASILGGCCGTSPEYIEKLVENTTHCEPVSKPKTKHRYLSSERKTISFGLEDSFLVIGERINPTGKKKLQEELRQGIFDLVEQFTQEQEQCGASVLDVNLGMSGIDELEMMKKTVELVTQLTSLPLAIDSSHVEVIEAALRRYPGRALINSISYEQTKFQQLLPLAKKYGAMFILLPLSDEGLPKGIEEKKHIIQRIVQAALDLDMKKEDIIVDGLVTTVGANKFAALETLEVIRYCKKEGLATTCGLSNISFGLPERGYVNTTFLTMAIQAGLTSAIANPSQQQLMSCAFASDLLLNKENSDVRYIEYMNTIKQSGVISQEVPKEESITMGLKEAVLKGSRKTILSITKEAVAQKNLPSDLLNNTLLPAINEVGDLFDKGKYFLPQLIASAEAMKIAIEYLEPMLQRESGQKEMPAIVIATVEGDIHDIGKNLVTLMLKNHGFRVIDLGKDVPKEKIIETAIESQAKIIALSALMTTTMQEMKQVITYAKKRGVTSKIIIGGAVITADYAKEIQADGYSKDAADAVKLVKQLLNL